MSFPERKALIERLAVALDMDITDNANHAFSWPCDLQVLQSLVQSSKSGNNTAVALDMDTADDANYEASV